MVITNMLFTLKKDVYKSTKLSLDFNCQGRSFITIYLFYTHNIHKTKHVLLQLLFPAKVTSVTPINSWLALALIKVRKQPANTIRLQGNSLL